MSLIAALVPLSPAGAMEQGLSVVFGQVLAGGAPVASAEVSVGPETAITSRSGRFLLEVPPGEYELTVILPYNREIRRVQTVELAAGEQRLDIEVDTLEQRVPEAPASAGTGPELWYVVLGYFAPDETTAEVARQAGDVTGAGEPQLFLAEDGSLVVTLGGPRIQAQALELAQLAREAGVKEAESVPAALWLEALPVPPGAPIEALVEVLIERLVSDAEPARRGARRALARIGQPAVEPLLGTLGRLGYRGDLGVLESLAGMETWRGPPEVLEGLWEASRRYDEAVVRSALERALASYDRRLALAALGYDDRSLEGAVTRFQRDHGLLVDGILGPRTGGALTEQLVAHLAQGGEYEPPARVFVHIGSFTQRPAAEAIARRIESMTLAGERLRVAEIQMVKAMPRHNELRFLKSADAEEAERLHAALGEYIPGLELKNLSARYDDAPQVKRRTYELWLVDVPERLRYFTR